MVSVEDTMGIVIFVSYCILSLIVFHLFVKNATNLHGFQVTSVVILTGMFLMFCALTHISNLWGGSGHRILTFICAAVSAATAVVTINLRSDIDQMLTNRFRAVQLVKDETILDLMRGYNLNVNVANNTIVSGTVNGNRISHPRHLSILNDEIKTGSVIDLDNSKFRIIHKLESDINLHHIQPECERGEALCSFSLFGVDITEEFRNQKLVKMNNQKQLALCLSTAHNIRTPLTSVSFLAKSLRRNPADVDVLDELSAHIELLNLVATNMMEAGRLLAGYKLIPTNSVVDVRRVFARMKRLSQYIHTDKVKCSFRVEKSVPELCVSDEEWFWHMFLIFVTTALKYTPSGYVKSTCSAEKKRKTTFLTLRVVDSGIGITGEDSSQLFEMFVDLKTHADSNKGVGLYTVKKKVGILGGFCSIVPNKDCNGSVFQATFPVSDVDGETSITSCEEDSNPIKSILVVDDTSTIIIVMQRALWEHHVDVAHNGKEALDLMLQKEYDYVFMDLSMPIMGGIEATLKFREKEQYLDRENKQRIVMMSATEIDRPDIFDMKLPKPIDHALLNSILADHRVHPCESLS